MLTNPITHFGEGEEQRSPTSLPVITEGNVLFCDGNAINTSFPLDKTVIAMYFNMYIMVGKASI